jgi:hypothetical protein
LEIRLQDNPLSPLAEKGRAIYKERLSGASGKSLRLVCPRGASEISPGCNPEKSDIGLTAGSFTDHRITHGC